MRGCGLVNQETSQLADQFLSDWYRWSRSWRPHLGYPRLVPYCRQSRTSRQYDEDAGYDDVFRREMMTVDACVSKLPGHLQQAIVRQMRNREAKACVWRSGLEGSYQEALVSVTALMVRKGLIY